MMTKYAGNKIYGVKFELDGAENKLMNSTKSSEGSSNTDEEATKHKSHDNECGTQGSQMKTSGGNVLCNASEGNERIKKSEHESASERSITSFEEELMFRCPELGDEVLSRREWKLKFREQLSILKETDDILAAILSIKSLNPPKEAEECVSLLEKYMKNLIDYPDVDKFRCIRLGNQILSEKILCIEGGLDFLLSIGFKTAIGGKDNMEPYLIYSQRKDLESIMKSLRSVTGFELQIDRNLRIIRPQDVPNKEDVTDEFYDWTLADMKKEHKSRREEMEKKSQLRGNVKNRGGLGRRDCSYTKIRVKFPDGIIVEAVFSIKEKLYSLKSLLLSQFFFYDNFSFMALPSRVFDVLHEEKTFAELELYPNVILMLKWETNSSGQKYVIKEETT